MNSSSNSACSCLYSCSLHVALFPFMSKGHTIPLLYLVKLIHNHRPQTKFTIFTTPANEPFILSFLSSLPPHLINTITLSFPSSSEIFGDVESTDQLPSMSLFYPFLYETEKLQAEFEIVLGRLQEDDHPVNFLVSDGFLHWTQTSASKFNIPRLAFYGMNNYSLLLYSIVEVTRLFSKVEYSEDELFEFPDVPGVRVTRNDFDPPWNEPEPQGPGVEYMAKCGVAMSKSYGLLVNSFYELESQYLDYWNSKFGPKAWSIGPLCLADNNKPKFEGPEKCAYINWLDQKCAERKCVLYIAFGTQAEISNEQLKEIMIGVEKSGVDFLWVLRIKPSQEEVIEGLEKRVEKRGLIVRGWVNQREILEHEAIKGCLIHCGWNSVSESICASVPILGFPMIAEQHLNVRMIVEEIKVGLRVNTCNGSVRGFVKWEELSKMIKELMFGEMGEIVRKNVEELAKESKKAIQEGGSSWHSLKLLLDELERDEIADEFVKSL